MLTMDTNLKVKEPLDENTRATTQYTNFNFRGMCNFNGKRYGVNSSGLYRICGDTDNGVDIDAYFEPVVTDFGIDNPKRVRFMYFGYESNGNLLITAQADEQVERTYTVDNSKTGSRDAGIAKTAQQRHRVPIGRDGSGRYWRFQIANVDGCDFAVDTIQLRLVVRNQGHGY